jgi:hypothetical protein
MFALFAGVHPAGCSTTPIPDRRNVIVSTLPGI